MPADFVHLHVHSEFSLLDGLGRVDDLVRAAVDQEMPSLALTDHGTMFGAIDFYVKARDAGIKPILGCEVYVSDRPIDEKPQPDSRIYHLVLLAQNEAGYRNLIKLTTEAHLRGFYRKPRVDRDLLARHAEGLICLSACASGEVAQHILDGNMPAATETADWYRQVFPDRYYLELQDHSLDFQARINEGVVLLGRDLDLPLIATNDVHYVEGRQAETHEILLCVQTQTTMDDPKRMKMDSQEFYLKTPDQMRGLFGEYPAALANSLLIAERCDLQLSFGRPHLPEVVTPDGQTSEEYLRHLAEDGVYRRYSEVTDEIRERLNYELAVITDTGFPDYLLLVYDVIHFARERGIPVGPGRGSAAASLVAYCLFLTNVDPIANGLSFERFLNPERVSMPDMDLDFADDRRDEVIRYVTEKYGRDRVAQIITFGTIGPRAGVRDVGRALGMSYQDVDRVAKLIPFTSNKLAKAREDVPEIQQLYDGDPAMKRLLDTVEDMEGVARHASIHAAGVVISRDPLAEHVPLYRVPKTGQVTTQYAMGAIEKMGLLKLDILGLRTLTILDRARALIVQRTGRDLVLDEIPLEDPSIYELLRTDDTFGIFQVDGEGMRAALRGVQASEFKHIVALVALYRPGPMQHIPEFVARKNGQAKIRYQHEALREVLEETYGVVVYQDQVMRLAVQVAGYSMGEADLLRRAMGKKKPEELARHRDDFIRRAAERGTDPKTAEDLFNTIEPFAGYAFNKAHAAAYAVITCQTAYLKANYPLEFMCGILSAESENADKVSEALQACRRIGITILPPDINRSGLDFVIEEEGIRFGLGAIKHAGSGAIESIVSTRGDTAFKSIEDFCTRVDWKSVNKRALESLIRSGALDSIGQERNRMLQSLDRIAGFGAEAQRAAMAGQVSLFGQAETPEATVHLAVVEPASIEEKVAWEQELLGAAVTRHPVVDASEKFAEVHAVSVSDALATGEAGRIRIGGLLRSLRSFSTKDGRPMATFQITDLQSTVDAVVFSRSYENVQGRLTDNAIVVVEGRLDDGDGRVRVLADGVLTMDEARERPPAANGNGKRSTSSKTDDKAEAPRHGGSGPAGTALAGQRLTIEIRRSGNRAADVQVVMDVYKILQQYRGDDEVEIVVLSGSRGRNVPLPSNRIRCCEQLYAALKPLIGDSWSVQPLGAGARLAS